MPCPLKNHNFEVRKIVFFPAHDLTQILSWGSTSIGPLPHGQYFIICSPIETPVFKDPLDTSSVPWACILFPETCVTLIFKPYFISTAFNLTTSPNFFYDVDFPLYREASTTWLSVARMTL